VPNLANHVNAICGISHATYGSASLLSRGSSIISIPILDVGLPADTFQLPFFDRFIPQDRPMAIGHVDPADWLLDRRHSRRATVYDLTWQPRRRHALQHVARTGDNGYSRPRWYFPRALLHPRLRRPLRLQSASKFFLCIVIFTAKFGGISKTG
jgi:hypothetical protein